MFESLFESPYAVHGGASSKQRGDLRNKLDDE